MRVDKLSGIVLRVTAILICLVLFSAHLASGMFAKYTAGASEESSARVAKLGRVKIIEEEALSLDSVGNGTYKFLVKNNSETAFRYDIKLKITTDEQYVEQFGADEIAKACTDVKVYSDEEVDGVDGVLSDDGTTYIFSMADIVPRDSESCVYTIAFKANDLVFSDPNLQTLHQSENIPITFDVSAKGTQYN